VAIKLAKRGFSRRYSKIYEDIQQIVVGIFGWIMTTTTKFGENHDSTKKG
jgi:hypothetical protein